MLMGCRSPIPIYSCVFEPHPLYETCNAHAQIENANKEVSQLTQLHMNLQRFCWSRIMHARQRCYLMYIEIKMSINYTCVVSYLNRIRRRKMNKSVVYVIFSNSVFYIR